MELEKAKTIRLSAVILRVIVSGEQQKALHRRGRHSVHAKLISPVTCWVFSFKKKKDLKKGRCFSHSTMPSVSSSLTVVCHISKGFSFFSSESADTRTKMAQKKIANEDEARRREATMKLKGEVSEAEVSVQVTPTR